MSDMHRARKATVNDRVSSISGERSALSGERSAIQKASWQDLSEARGSDDKTKNFVVPAELIALARSNLARRAPAREPFAAKPTLVVPIVVPPAAIPVEKRVPTPPPAAAPVETPVAPPVTTLKAKVAPVHERLARASSQPPGRQPSRRPPPFEPSNPLAAFQPPRPPAFESWRPAPASSEDAVPESGERSPLRAYAPFLTAAVIVGAYVGLCYFANTLIAWLP
jgi:hypothetical protein